MAGETDELWSYQRRPPHMDVWLSCAEAVHPDELNEELDMFPLLMPNVVVREWSDSAAERHRVDPDGAQGCGNAG